ncbi:Hsp20/alpha crystallin family protein [Thiospirochaeta perfilievii]|uniref:Hsp20/alpha crystallin family protein n=1 Tax=Thiospirochaeta perfilievii TaxID=252967 RepID=A0A5C1QDT8_9SPIO|nr:Hsp20/alpha crystallin family protein [Thiospirochaeta perfilievii]QEN04362.1 Hsp20/alpha crystallin family protein [Thiospirochaeta perfilievii]
MKDKKELDTRKTMAAFCNIYHDENSIIMSLEMPGVTKENLDIKVDKDLLIIHGKRDLYPEDGEYLVKEIKDYDYHQEYTIDNTIDRENIDATIKNGVVTLTLGIKESAKPRTIKITTS